MKVETMTFCGTFFYAAPEMLETNRGSFQVCLAFFSLHKPFLLCLYDRGEILT